MALTVDSLGPALEVSVQGRLDKADYEKLTPAVEEHVREHGKIGFLVHVTELDGFSPSAMWADIQLYAKHHGDVSRIAFVAEEPSKQQWISTVTKPFTRAEVRFYAEADVAAARAWVIHREGPGPVQPS